MTLRPRHVVGILTVAATLMAASGASAQAAAPTPSARPWLAQRSGPLEAARDGGDSGSAWRGIGALLLLLGLGGAGVYFRLRRSQPRGVPALGPLRVLGTTRLGPRAQVVVVQVGRQQALLGVTDQQITKLLDLPELVTAVDEGVEVGSALVNPADRLSSLLERATSARNPTRGREFQQQLEEAARREEAMSAALQIAEETRDQIQRTAVSQRAPGVEGQAAGLAARFRRGP